MTTKRRRVAVSLAALFLFIVFSASAGAQTAVTISGRLLHSVSGDPIGDATIQIDELRRQSRSAADGTVSFENVPPRTYHLSVRSSGYSSRHIEVTVGTTATGVGDLAGRDIGRSLTHSDVFSVHGWGGTRFRVRALTFG